MSDEAGTYRCLMAAVEEVIFKERKSKFIGYAYPVRTEEDIKLHLESLKRQYPDANHICYAWKLGVQNPVYRAQDDGEPRNSAGVPIYGQINSFELTNTVVFVVRYFGGVKLGVGGLVSAYKTAARQTLELGVIQEKDIICGYRLNFEYAQMNTLQGLFNRLHINVLQRIMEEEAEFIIEVPIQQKATFLNAVKKLYTVRVEEIL